MQNSVQTTRAAEGYSADDEISLQDIFRILNAHRLLIVSCVAIGTVLAGIAAFVMTPIYRAEVLLAPVSEEKGGGGLSSLAGQLGGLAALAGANISLGGGSKDEAIALLESRMLTERFIQQENLMPVLFAGSWDAAAKNWIVEDAGDIPSLGDAYNLWDKKIRRVSEDKKTGLITLAIEWKDREQAAKWAAALVKLVNATMAERAVSEAKKSSDYLNSELQKTSIVEVQQSIFRLIEAQIKTIMLANVREEYSFKVIDPAVVSDEDAFVKPKRLLLIVLGFMLGGMLGVFAAFLRNTR